jgi:hypothetical protein
MSDNVIKVVRVLKLETKLVAGKPTMVPNFTIEREKEIENYDINYDNRDQRYMVAREW